MRQRYGYDWEPCVFVLLRRGLTPDQTIKFLQSPRMAVADQKFGSGVGEDTEAEALTAYLWSRARAATGTPLTNILGL